MITLKKFTEVAREFFTNEESFPGKKFVKNGEYRCPKTGEYIISVLICPGQVIRTNHDYTSEYEILIPYEESPFTEEDGIISVPERMKLAILFGLSSTDTIFKKDKITTAIEEIEKKIEEASEYKDRNYRVGNSIIYRYWLGQFRGLRTALNILKETLKQ